MDSSKRSQIVILTMIGATFGAVELANSFPPTEMRRNLYPDRAACERDYSQAQCQPNSSSSSGTSSGSSSGGHGGGSGSYHGPYYAASRSGAVAASDPGPGRTGQVTRVETSSRGGFGAFGRVAHAVG